MAEFVRPASSHRAPLQDWMTIVTFDGVGGVRALPDAEEAGFVAPEEGFVLVSGSAKAPEFKAWLKKEVGEFYADLITVPSTRSRCTVLDDKALVVLRVARPGAEPEDVGRQLLSLWLESGGVIIAAELNSIDCLAVATHAARADAAGRPRGAAGAQGRRPHGTPDRATGRIARPGGGRTGDGAADGQPRQARHAASHADQHAAVDLAAT